MYFIEKEKTNKNKLQQKYHLDTVNSTAVKEIKPGIIGTKPRPSQSRHFTRCSCFNNYSNIELSSSAQHANTCAFFDNVNKLCNEVLIHNMSCILILLLRCHAICGMDPCSVGRQLHQIRFSSLLKRNLLMEKSPPLSKSFTCRLPLG